MSRDLLDRHRSLQVLIGLAILAVAIYAIDKIWAALVFFGDVILLFFLAWILAFILQPASVFLQRRGIPRVAAVSLVFLALIIAIAGAIVLAVPTIEQQVRLFASELTHFLSATNVNTWTKEAVALLRRIGFSPQGAQNVITQVSTKLPEWANGLTNTAVNSLTSIATSILTILFDATLITIIAFYMMVEGERNVESLVRRLPPAWVADVRLFQRNVEEIFGGFFRAQVIVAAIYGLLTWIILFILGQSNGLVVAILSAVFMLLPMIGAFLAIVPPVVLLLVQTPPDQLAFKIILLVFLLGAAQHIVLNLIAPRIIGQHMGIPTLLLFAALFVGAKEGGVWGAIFAGPVIAVAYAMAEVFFERFRAASSLYPDVTGEPPEASHGKALPAGGGSDGKPSPAESKPSSPSGGPEGENGQDNSSTDTQPRETITRGSGTPYDA